MTPARDRIAFPLDVPDLASAKKWIDLLHEDVGVFKVGLELFTRVGPPAIELVQKVGAKCFLDLKLHDIPATMAGAVRSAVELGVAYLTIHASAGPAALRLCSEAAAGSFTQLLGVTVLTSLDGAELAAIGFPEEPATLVRRLGTMAHAAGVSGFVCSPQELEPLRSALGRAVILVTPGIRPADSPADDQRRTATPAEAVRAGANLLVVGRPIRSAADPRAATQAILASIEQA